MKRSIILATVLLVILGIFTLSLSASAQKGNMYDYIMQDDSGCPVLMFSSRTGQYMFVDDEFTLAGFATFKVTGYTLKMSFKNSGYFGQFQCDLKTKVGSGTLIETTPWEVEAAITDTDMTNNTGLCPTN